LEIPIATDERVAHAKVDWKYLCHPSDRFL